MKVRSPVDVEGPRHADRYHMSDKRSVSHPTHRYTVGSIDLINAYLSANNICCGELSAIRYDTHGDS